MISGQLVLVTLNNPREKFWGMLLALDPAGVSVRGVDLQSLDDFTQLVKSGEAASASVVSPTSITATAGSASPAQTFRRR